MCGITGFTFPQGGGPAERRARFAQRLTRMTQSLVHRGPDALCAELLDGIALGHTRLAIVDLSGGHQPMRDERTGVTLVFNGEIFNYVELRQALAATYAFRTKSDTEVILAAYLAKGMACVDTFVGQWAFALWDPRDRTLHLSRDRVGIQPLHYVLAEGQLAFASEIRALLDGEWASRAFDSKGILETTQLWAPAPGRTCFEGVYSLPPGSNAAFRQGQLTTRRYWDLDLSDSRPGRSTAQEEKRATEALGEILEDAVRLRLRADVPVAAYLSGGLDSSVLCAIAQKQLGGTLQTFSLQFEQAGYDERTFQNDVATALKTQHHATVAADEDTGTLLPRVVSHTEQVLLRAAPAPMLKLSSKVREHQTKVVLTGEGSDEVFWGYDLFKETQVRRFWARQPDSTWRPALFQRLYPYLPLAQQGPQMLKQFFGLGLEAPNHFAFSHLIRWTNSGRIGRFFSEAFMEKVKGHRPDEALAGTLPERVKTWRPLPRAQYLEMQTLLSGYLLSAQGDRMLMANSVEGRFPFLDHRVMELAAKLPEGLKLRALTEKYLLRQYARTRVPLSVLNRPKHPYRAPIAQALTGPAAPDWTKELLNREAVDRVGVFDGSKVEKLITKLSAGKTPPSEADNMALMAIASTQLLSRSHLTPQAPGRFIPVELTVA